MPTINQPTAIACYHCGEDCTTQSIALQEKYFCCEGCKTVYQILNKSGMCNYYTLSNNPGINQKQPIRSNKFLFLDDEVIQQSLITYKDTQQTHLTFYLPQIHCSSCLWLLENLHHLEPAIISSKVNFEKKEVDIVFTNNQTTLRKVAELLTSVGYEPYISLNNLSNHTPQVNKSKIYKLGVAGFCFANIMLMSFPEYLGIDTKEQQLVNLFRYLNLFLSLPVFFYAASEFYISAWKSLKHGFLNIDAPIVLSVIITFGRSVYEVFTGTGLGYFDSMSGIVFFMLVGRVLQDKTHSALSFERDYTSYFPIAVTKMVADTEMTVALPQIRLDDTLLIHNQELIPADGILTRGKALIDYSFVTGESTPVEKEMGEIVYAGGKQIGSNIEILVIKEVAQSYLTKLWNREELHKNKNYQERSFVHLLSRHFTWVIFSISLFSAIYWGFTDSSKMWSATTAVLIVACPCALLLSNTFTNGNILRILGRNKLYLRNAQTIEDIANVNMVVFDKTGTLTTGSFQHLHYEGCALTTLQKKKIALLAAQSSHPLSKSICRHLGEKYKGIISAYQEHAGLGIEGVIDNDLIALGAHAFVNSHRHNLLNPTESSVYVAIEGDVLGKFVFTNHYRQHIPQLLQQLQKQYPLAILSGDNAGERSYLQSLLGSNTQLLFQQKPEDKLAAIQQLQQKGKNVMMLGDGLNDAGALQQANVGIAVAEESNTFTPASDAILEASRLAQLIPFIRMCKTNKRVVMAAFIVSVLYNVVGISFAVQGNLSPMIAAILMPCSSISILLITFGISNVAAWHLGLLRKQ